MAANIIKVNTVSLARTRDEVQTRLDQVRKAMDQIAADMDALNSRWEGEAHQAFSRHVAEDIQFLAGGCDSIQEIIRYETNAVTEYDKCEQQVSDLIGQIRV